jgi:thioredoxin reductase (NADPH)
MVDVAVIGAGPAGLSAAINVRARGKGVLVVGNPPGENPLGKAPVIDNYPGLPGIGGAQLLQTLWDHAERSGAQLRVGRVLTAAPAGDGFFLSIGSQVEQARAVVLAIGAQRGVKLPGEEPLLGRGVSWCATCDGMLYRNRPVVVVGLSYDAPAEANLLQEMGCQVTYAGRTPPSGLRPDIPVVLGKRLSIQGDKAVEAVLVDEQALPCQGAFVLREAVAPADLLPGLAMEGGYVAVDRAMATNLPGVFACGDCTGLPLQVARAVGEGLIAGQSAADYADRAANQE